MITERLKVETKANHEETESFSYGNKIMDGSLTIDEYKQLIIKNYVYHLAVEKALVDFAQLSTIEGLELQARLKTAALAKDLELLNINPDSLAKITPPVFQSVEEALGFMYVVEGATLGGAYILKALNRNSNILAQVKEFNYYGVYGETIGAKWKSFQAALLNTITTKEQEDKTIEAAKHGFDIFRDVFKNEQVAA